MTTIAIKRNTREKLENFRVYKRETLNDIIERIIDYAKYFGCEK